MYNFDKLIEIVNKNNGVITTGQAVKAKIAKDYLKHAVSDGVLEKIATGIYMLKDNLADDFFVLQLKRTKIVFSHATSAYFNDLTTRDPIVITMTVPSGYNARELINAGHRVYFCSQPNYKLGIVETKTMFGNKIRIYDAERSICDLFSARYSGDIYIVLESLKNYLRSKEKDITKLMTYAKQLGVEKKVRENTTAMMEAVTL